LASVRPGKGGGKKGEKRKKEGGEGKAASG